ncbi:hypothetical protein [Bacillus sp. ISL-37]|uniref:hypothetical protein n=1 Tax=Bacillus sp. ISL-37 TaxID=2819123 RepID=UPI001BE7DFAC|nr:hypothetical protein [Bacillus sp. ISL-37]
MIEVEGAQTPAGSAGQVSPTGANGGEEAHRQPRGRIAYEKRRQVVFFIFFPRKAKRLERKSTALFTRAFFKLVEIPM